MAKPANTNHRVDPTDTQMHRPQALLDHMGANVYRAAYERGMSLSAYLEHQDRSSGYQDGLDAFGRLLHVAGITERTNLAWGVYASEYEAFLQNERTRALIPEWAARIWRGVQTGRRVSTRSMFLSDDQVAGSFERPWADASARWDTQIAPAIPLSSLVAITTPIDGDSYRSYYLTNDASAARMVRVGESAPIPTAKLVAGEHTIDLYKYGRGIEATYETLRRVRVDKIGLFIARMAVQAEVDKVSTVIDVLINGDGNAGTAPTPIALTTLDSGTTANNLTLRAWLNFKMQFTNPYMITLALARNAIVLNLLLLDVGSANVPLVNVEAGRGFGGFEQINQGLRDNVALGWTADAPANQIIGVDGRFAIERVTEVGSNIQETERFIRNQSEILVMTEVEGYTTIDSNSIKIMNLAA